MLLSQADDGVIDDLRLLEKEFESEAQRLRYNEYCLSCRNSDHSILKLFLNYFMGTARWHQRLSKLESRYV